MQILVQQHMDNPIEMWSALQKLHEQDNPAARFNAFDEFFNISKQEDETLQSLVVKSSEHSRGPLSLRMSAIVQYISLNKYISKSKDKCNS